MFRSFFCGTLLTAANDVFHFNGQLRANYTFRSRTYARLKVYFSNVDIKLHLAGVTICQYLAAHDTENSGFLMGPNGRLYKNISHDARGEKEECFYKKVFSDEKFTRFRDFIPT